MNVLFEEYYLSQILLSNCENANKYTSNGIIPRSGGGRVAFEIGDNWGGKVPMDIYSIYIEKNIVRKDSKIFF